MEGMSVSRRTWRFNPYEIAVCGYKHSGKTTLLEAVARELSRTMRIAYLKHDAHHFSMDHAGKDTHRLTQAGAIVSTIRGKNGTGCVTSECDTEILFSYDLLAADALLVEGYKNSDLPRIMLLDLGLTILDDPAWATVPPIAVAHPFQPGGATLDSIRNTLATRFGTIPLFHRSDIAGLCGFMTRTWEKRRPPLRGLLLTNEKSLDGAVDLSDGEKRSQFDLRLTWMQRHCDSVSVSGDFPDNTLVEGHVRFANQFAGMGTMGRILEALGCMNQPNSAWLVLATNQPWVDDRTLPLLVKQRAPQRFATAFRGRQDLPEPLYAIYEPKSFPRLLQFVGVGHRCLSTCLNNSPTHVLSKPDASILYADG